MQQGLKQLATWLASDGGQSHLLSGWEDAALEDKRRLLAQAIAARVRFRVDALCPVARGSRPHARLTPTRAVQVAEMDAKYPSDAQGRRGLAAYVAHAKELLAESAADKNPFEGYAVEVPEGDRL